MLKDITLGQYYPVKSPLHKLDPRVKILLVFAFIILLFFVKNFVGYVVFAIFTGIVIKLSHVPLKFMLKGLKPLFFIMVFTAVLNLFMVQGEHVMFRIWKLTATYEGLRTAIFMILRLVFLILGTSLLTLTTTPLSLTDGIESLLRPFRKIGLPAHELAMMMSIAIRFIPTLLEETNKIMQAQAARGSDFESGGLIKRAKALIPILIPLFVSAFRRADELAVAMECRCYNGGENRTRMRELKMHSNDAVASAVIVLLIGVITFTNLFPLFSQFAL
jgi:energy-coupling factor transport system permease protein